MSKHERENDHDKSTDEIKVEIKDKKSKVEPGEIIDKEPEKPSRSEKEVYDEKIAELEGKLKEGDDKFLRLAAEFDNFRKRTARQFEEMSQAGRIAVIARLLDVLDNFQRALEAAANSHNHDSLLEGMQLIYKSLYDLLAKEGLEPIEAVGRPFDPNLHDAMMQMESDEYPDGIVAQEMVKGYKLGGKVLRHSRVAVSRGKAGENESKAEKAD